MIHCVHAGSVILGNVILGNVMKLPDLPESLKIPGSQLKLSRDPIGQGKGNISTIVRVVFLLHYLWRQ